MRKILAVLSLALIVGCSLINQETEAKFKEVKITQPFEAYVLADGLNNPWNIVYGPDKMLWVTERTGKSIVRINPETGMKKNLFTIEEVNAAEGQQGLLGLDFAPGFLQSGQQNLLYVFYTYQPNDGISKHGYKKLVSYEYEASQERLVNPQTILDKIPAGDDHNGGRLVYGPDGKIYISLGEHGHNQGANFRLPIEAQRLPTAQEVNSKDWSAYVGKVLRVMPDGSIPKDNPLLNGVRSHVFTYGHRNPQGLAFAKDKLYSAEHGPSTDDELNLLESGGNYGWPHIAGFPDNQAYVYANWSKAPQDPNMKWDANIIDPRVPVQNELDWAMPENYKNPVKTFYTVRTGYNFQDGQKYGDLAYALWATIAPSGIAYYPENGPIEGWGNSIVIAALKSGALYRVKLNSDQSNVQGDVVEFFHTPNRYRDVCFSPDLRTIFIITDSQGTAKGYDMKPTDKVQNPGAVLAINYNPRS